MKLRMRVTFPDCAPVAELFADAYRERETAEKLAAVLVAQTPGAVAHPLEVLDPDAGWVPARWCNSCGWVLAAREDGPLCGDCYGLWADDNDDRLASVGL